MSRLREEFDRRRHPVGELVHMFIAGVDDLPAFISAAYDVADLHDVPLLDLGDRMDTFSVYNADDQPYDPVSDTVHLTPAGNAMKMATWLDLLDA